MLLLICPDFHLGRRHGHELGLMELERDLTWRVVCGTRDEICSRLTGTLDLPYLMAGQWTTGDWAFISGVLYARRHFEVPSHFEAAMWVAKFRAEKGLPCPA